MLNSKYKWRQIYENVVIDEEELLTVLLKNRQVTDRTLYFSNEGGFHDPFLFKEMRKAVNRIKEAIQNNEKIMLYGDYDVDGVTGTAILFKTIKRLAGSVTYCLPNRFKDGYGPNQKIFERFVDENYKLVITIDNGITGIKEADYLKESGVDLIITDHHESKSEIPSAYAILHPKIENEGYPFKDLSGCGVALKLAHALLGDIPHDLLDLAALGTYADIVSLLGENRQILKAGLKQLSNTSHLGLKMVMQVAKTTKIDEFALGFIFGPRLNAPGRMENGSSAVDLLVTEDVVEALNLANEIELINNERKALIDEIMKEAIEVIEQNNYHLDNVIIVHKESWHEGVIGIIANRLVEKYSKPVIVFTESEGLYKGSARTLADFPLYLNLELCSDLLHKYGGHKMAAGLTIKKDNLSILRERLHKQADYELISYCDIDCELDIKLINLELITKLEHFRPFGEQNQRPLFMLRNVKVTAVIPMGNNKHLRLNLLKDGIQISGVMFSCNELFLHLNENDTIDVIGNLDINEYNNKTSIQFRILDLRCHHKQIYDCRSKQINCNLTHQYLYFTNNYGYNNANSYSKDLPLTRDIVLIDIPERLETLKDIMHHHDVQNVYVMFKCDSLFDEEDLINREKLAKVYQIIKRLQEFKLSDSVILKEFNRYGFSKKVVLISIKVFFELKFVIIENDYIKIIETKEKKDLNESKTYREIQEFIALKEKLILSSSRELKEFLMGL